MLLGVNIDHVATLREARGTTYPDPVAAAQLAAQAGANIITLHLREDRRHIQDADVGHIRDAVTVPINLELANSAEMIHFARTLIPQHCCLVPERRQELTTEGGLDVLAQGERLATACAALTEVGIRVSVFIDALPEQIEAAASLSISCVELHTGPYANADADTQALELIKLNTAAKQAQRLGLQVHAGHGLHYQNVTAVARSKSFSALNIGHSIIAKALFTGLEQAVQEMKQKIDAAMSTP